MSKSTLTTLFVLLTFSGFAQQPANRPTLVAGIPVNYNEDSVGTYTLPDLLTCNDGMRGNISKNLDSKTTT